MTDLTAGLGPAPRGESPYLGDLDRIPVSRERVTERRREQLEHRARHGFGRRAIHRGGDLVGVAALSRLGFPGARHRGVAGDRLPGRPVAVGTGFAAEEASQVPAFTL
ncbi:hypothetical protein [Actinoallomurus acaciae]|uniref:Uncharacterized protein n=1 Tax=Actinoallomurus acaciae TaxID=502577 RepID=A0ABV5YRI7_9ACTN